MVALLAWAAAVAKGSAESLPISPLSSRSSFQMSLPSSTYDRPSSVFINRRRPRKCEVDRVIWHRGSIVMSSSDHNEVIETAQASAQFQSSGAQPLSRRVYQNTKTQGGHLHQGDHYGDKVYNILGDSKEINLFQAACDTIEASLPIEQCVDLVRSLLVSSENYTLPGDSPTAFGEVVDVLESLDEALHSLKVTGRCQNYDELVDLIPDCESIIDNLRAAVGRIFELHGASEPLPRRNCVIRRVFIECHGEDWIFNLTSQVELLRFKVYGSITRRVRSAILFPSHPRLSKFSVCFPFFFSSMNGIHNFTYLTVVDELLGC